MEHPEATRHTGNWRTITTDGKLTPPELRHWWECDWCSSIVMDGEGETIDEHLDACPDREV